jgi:hypothetical protein
MLPSAPGGRPGSNAGLAACHPYGANLDHEQNAQDDRKNDVMERVRFGRCAICRVAVLHEDRDQKNQRACGRVEDEPHALGHEVY